MIFNFGDIYKKKLNYNLIEKQTIFLNQEIKKLTADSILLDCGGLYPSKKKISKYSLKNCLKNYNSIFSKKNISVILSNYSAEELSIFKKKLEYKSPTYKIINVKFTSRYGFIKDRNYLLVLFKD